MKKVLVTGAAGAIGINVIKYLLSEGKYEITALDLRNRHSNSVLKKYKKRVNIILGDVNVQSIHDIWNGEKMNAVRRKHQVGTWQECAPCKKCALPRKTVFNESFKVDGRTISPENPEFKNR